MSISVDYEDMKATADGFRTLADDLRSARPTGLPTGTDVYGYPVLAVAVDRMVEAFGDRHDALTRSSESIAERLDLCRRAYEAVDRLRAEALEAIDRAADSVRGLADRAVEAGSGSTGGGRSTVR